MRTKIKRHLLPPQSRHAQESGVALLTVLALLSIFAVILVGYMYSLRMEEITVQQYAVAVNVQEGTEAAVQGVLSQVARDLDPSKPHIVLGREQPRYVSMLDPWAVGYAGEAGLSVKYDARSKMEDIRSDRLVKRTDLKYYPQPFVRGIDEDSPGDQSKDGAAGLKGIDDDMDGVVDNVRPGSNESIKTYENDDDEDYMMDEDPPNRRRPDTKGQYYFAPGTGYDEDGDMLGVFDENSKININFAGNTNGNGGAFTYNLGASPAELDLPLFLYNRVVQYLSPRGVITPFSDKDANLLAQNIVNFRNGSTADYGATVKRPGVDSKDDNNNNSTKIVQVQTYSNALKIAQFQGEPFAIIGNQLDDDNDGLLNEEDERYIGTTTATSAGTTLTEPINNKKTTQDFRPGDRIDNNGDGYIDEYNEGIDEPEEFSVLKPTGDDRPYATVDDLKLVGIIRNNYQKNLQPGQQNFPTLFEILRDSTTIYSQSDEVSGNLSGKTNEVAKINPNNSNNWRALDISDPRTNEYNRADFQYSPPIRIEDLVSLQVDNDKDWQLHSEPDVEEGKADGKDNDGDGLIDESSDDWDANQYASGDFDGFGEPDVGSPAIQNGIDDDRDGSAKDEIGSGDDTVARLRLFADRSRDIQDEKLRPGMVVEGNGVDDDGDNLIDDDGDFNGDGLLSYDPEWHVSEDGFGDQSADGYPGLGADPSEKDKTTPAGNIVTPPLLKKDLLFTTFADDDGDGYADFYDPQVLAAMYAPEMDSVDNDNDGEVDEIGERYIACYDDDEDGRMDEDPAEFQLAMNLVDFVDSWAPYAVSSDPDVAKAMGKTETEPILADPVTFRTFLTYSTRQRALRMHPRLLVGPNPQSREDKEFLEFMRFLLPNPPQTGMKTTYEGVEAIRINEVMPKPVIRLLASEVLDEVDYNPTNTKQPVTIKYQSNRFQVTRGAEDDGQVSGEPEADSSWGNPPNRPAVGSVNPNDVPKAGFTFLPEGLRNTLNPLIPYGGLPLANMDSLAPAFIFSVTNMADLNRQNVNVGKQTVEEAEWTFENIPAGLYDVVLYLSPYHKYHPEVTYTFNNQVITFRSDYAFGDPNNFTGAAATVSGLEQIRRDTARQFVNTSPIVTNEFRLNYRLSPFPLANQSTVTDKAQRVEIKTDGKLTVKITANTPLPGQKYYETSFDRIELINPRVQYVELVNLSTQDIDLSGYTINTPYGHYILPDRSYIKRAKPSWKEDDGKDLQTNEGLPGTGVPFETLLDQEKAGQTINNQDLLLEDNKLLLAFDAASLKQFIRDNYPAVPNLEERVVEPQLATLEKTNITASIQRGAGSPVAPNAQLSDVRFRLFDVQEDVLTHNPVDKYVTLYDPSGNYLDSFKYRTTFNNVVVNIPGNTDTYDVVALPGYRGFEAYERTDPTCFETQTVVDPLSRPPVLSAKRSVPTMKLDARQAALIGCQLQDDGKLKKIAIGGYVGPTQGTVSDPNNTTIKRFADTVSAKQPDLAVDGHWLGWDFIGDSYQYPTDQAESIRNYVQTFTAMHAIAREAVTPAANEGAEWMKFYQKLGGFENATDFINAQSPLEDYATYRDRIDHNTQVMAFTWRFGVRELIRAGFDPDVDDQLTVRVLGRKYIGADGKEYPIDMPVGEVLVTPIMRIVNPGTDSIEKDWTQSDYQSGETPRSIFVNLVQGNRSSKVPVFSKLRNGDTAFTIQLREDFNQLWQDLRSNSTGEPMIEIAVIMRKTTRDLSPYFISNKTQQVPNPQLTWIYAQDRPDFPASVFTLSPIKPNAQGQYIYTANASSAPEVLGDMGDDNYFFSGIELFGRGRSKADNTVAERQRRALLAGTPGRDNSGYVPAYPRRRWSIEGNNRDIQDIIDNTPYVKNGLLATLGEVSRLYTGNKFETINTPIIPQRLEDKAVEKNRIMSNPTLAARSLNNNTYRIELSQRERLDQWENQYTQIYNMITTAKNGVLPGLININTAPREVLAALPSTPPLKPGTLDTLTNRHFFNTVVADFIIEGRQPGGHDLFYGIHDLNDSEFLDTYNKTTTKADTLPDYKLATVGRAFRYYKDFEDILTLRFNPLGLKSYDIEGKDSLRNIQTNTYLTTEVTDPDDGPYSDIGTLLAQITHLKRRERYSQPLTRDLDRTEDGKPEFPGDLRERLNAELKRELTPEDMEDLMNRISSLITVRSRAFGIVTRGRIFDTDNNIVAQRKLETVYSR